MKLSVFLLGTLSVRSYSFPLVFSGYITHAETVLYTMSLSRVL